MPTNSLTAVRCFKSRCCLYRLNDCYYRLGTAYLSAFFALPVTLSTGERLDHEEVVHKLEDETVSYEAELGVSGYFAETVRISIKVETDKYETAVRWIKDLVYGSEFDPSRSAQLILLLRLISVTKLHPGSLLLVQRSYRASQR